MYISPNVAINPITSFTPKSYQPQIAKGSHVQPNASVLGSVILSEGVLVSPFASIRGDEGTPIYIGKNSNVQDGVVIHGLENKFVQNNGLAYSVHIGDNVSLAHQAQVHGPAKIGNDTFVGMQSFVFKAEVGDNVVIEPTAKVIGVKIASGRYVPAGEVIKTQEQADKLPIITPEYAMKNLNHEVVHVNKELNKGYEALPQAYPANYYIN